MNHLTDSQLNEYLDGRLVADERRAVAIHLGSCDGCRMRLGEIQLVFDRLADLSEAPLSHDLTPAILTRIPQKSPPFLTPVYALQFAVVLGVLVWFASGVTRFFKPPILALPALMDIKGFHLPQISLSRLISFIPSFNLQSLTINFLLTAPNFQFNSIAPAGGDFHITFHKFQYWIDRLPAFQGPLPNSLLFLIILSVLLLWSVGNMLLLCDHPEAKK
jgi:hypothetical protein